MSGLWAANGRTAFAVLGILAVCGTVALAADDPAAQRPGDVAPAVQPADAASLRKEFNRLDGDSSGEISRDEFLAEKPEDQRTPAVREFLTMDFDNNGNMSFAEFQALKGIAIPDPWIELADKTFAALQETLKPADSNGDGKFTRVEWPQTELKKKLPAFGELNFRIWDADRSDEIDAEEIRRAVDLAYAVRIPGGLPARWPNGTVLHWSHFRDVDRNGDYTITKNEFVARHSLGRKENEAAFPPLDTDGDERLSYSEYTAAGSPFLVNLVAMFHSIDENADDRLSQDELLAKAPPVLSNVRNMDISFPAFDDDHDGVYNLREYRLSSVGGLYFTAQYLHRKDSNQDGAISWKEFNAYPKPLFVGIAAEVFRRYDQDGDELLTMDEYDLPLDNELQQLVAQMTPQLRPMLKAELRFFLSLCPVTDDQRKQLKPVVARSLSQAALRTAVMQKQMNRGWNPNQPPQFPDPQQIFGERFGRFAEDVLPADVAANYRQEIEEREQLRREATVLMLVARLDHNLVLTAEQRKKISESLLADWQPSWSQQIEFIAQNEYMIQLPDKCLTPHLTKEQRAVWQGITKTFFGFNINGVFGALEAGDDDDLKDLMPEVKLNQNAVPAPAGVGFF